MAEKGSVLQKNCLMNAAKRSASRNMHGLEFAPRSRYTGYKGHLFHETISECLGIAVRRITGSSTMVSQTMSQQNQISPNNTGLRMCVEGTRNALSGFGNGGAV